MFRVHCGTTATGRARFHSFATIESASEFCSTYFRRTGVILSIVRELSAEEKREARAFDRGVTRGMAAARRDMAAR